MTPWIEDVSMKRRYDDKAGYHKGRRAKIWHIEGYETGGAEPWHWEVKDGSNTLAFGDETSRGKALAAVDRVVKEHGWLP